MPIILQIVVAVILILGLLYVISELVWGDDYDKMR